MICPHCDKAEVRPGRECAWCGRIAPEGRRIGTVKETHDDGTVTVNVEDLGALLDLHAGWSLEGRVTLRGDWEPSDTGEAWVPSTEPEVRGEARLMRGYTVRRVRDFGEPLDVGTFEAVTTGGKVIVRPPGDAPNHRPRTGRCVVPATAPETWGEKMDRWAAEMAGRAGHTLALSTPPRHGKRAAISRLLDAQPEVREVESIDHATKTVTTAARAHPPTWAWVEREALDRFWLHYDYSADAALGLDDDRAHAAAARNVARLARLWQWMGAE